MNYRHAFHAGNFADIFKHLVLTRLLLALMRKETPFRVIDTHAGAGLYDLAGDEATRSPEWRDGIARFDAARMAPAAEEIAKPFRDCLAALRTAHGARTYPGSPLIIRHFFREADRLIASEAHRETANALNAALGRDNRVKILAQDGWLTLNATIPPPERRGLAFMDPAFESADEFAASAKALIAARRKWPTGQFAFWHPVKDVGAVERFMAEIAASGFDKILRTELQIDDPAKPGLNACGLLLFNPPFTLAGEMEILLPEVAHMLGRGAARWRCEWLAPERAGVASDRASQGRNK